MEPAPDALAPEEEGSLNSSMAVIGGVFEGISFEPVRILNMLLPL